MPGRKGISASGMESCNEFPFSIHYFVSRYFVCPDKVVAS